MTTYTLTAAQCKALLLHIPKSDVRYYLVGAHFAPDGIVSATDGHRALRVRAKIDGAGADGIVPRDLMVQAAKQKHGASFTIADGRVTLAPTGQSMPLVDGKFPDVDRVCPMSKDDARHEHSGDFDLRYQLDAREALDLLTLGPKGSKLAPLAVKWKAAQPHPEVAGFCHGDGFAMVLMPVRK